ncbi:MAG: FAD-dependent oxidoreductase, partial [Candidatus Hydrogenedentales bacterium]
QDGATAALPPSASTRRQRAEPASIMIIGGGAAGNACAESLRRLGYSGKLTMISADESLPCDRPNLSKDYLAGTAPEDWIPLRSADFYRSHNIEVLIGATVTRVDAKARAVSLADGTSISYDRLLLATGADPVRLAFQGNAPERVAYLRTLADARALIAAADNARSAVVIGASFIGLEVAASLRARGMEVHVVAPENQPLVKVLGPEVGAFIRGLHEERGVVFHLGNTVAAVDSDLVRLRDGETISAGLVVAGVGVRPSLALAEGAGVELDNGVVVSEFLETSIPGIFAAGDIAHWPDTRTGQRIRVEHWVVAERQGQTAARNMLATAAEDAREVFDAVPFFWSAHYDTTIRYVGHAERWDRAVVSGDLASGDAKVSYMSDGQLLAVATVGRDVENLRAEVQLETAVG